MEVDLFSTYDLKGFSLRLKEIRRSLGYTQENVVAGTGLSAETLRKLENGHTIPRYDTIEILSLFYKIDLQSVLNHYKSSKDLIKYYELIDFHVLGYNISSLQDTINDFKIFRENADFNLISTKELDQLELFFTGLQISYSDNLNKEVQLQALEMHKEAIKATNPNFNSENWKEFNYNHVELRILFSIASLYGYLRDCKLSNEILLFILKALDHSSYSKHYDKLLIIKLYGLVAYNYHRDSDDINIIKYADLGIDYCKKHGIMAGLPLLLFRKGVAKYHLGHSDYEIYLNHSVALLRVQGMDDAANDYELNIERYRRTPLFTNN